MLHLDVDVLDYLTLPVADIPTYGRGLDPATLERALRALGAGPGFLNRLSIGSVIGRRPGDR
ncbi:hypothetical protein GCM10027063_21320 [Promicromonospora xylanilytica]